jgi:hypothetical protein
MIKSILLSAILGLFVNHFSFNQEVWIVKPTSGLKVHGSSNVNSFICKVPSIGCYDTITINHLTALSGIKIDADLNIPIALFNCGNKIMTHDLKKTLKSEEYPQMKITFKKIESGLSHINPNKTVKVNTVIELAGVEKIIDVLFTAVEASDNKIILAGQKIVCFSDFNLKPPVKMAGAIKVRDQLNVELNLLLEKR